VTAGESVTAGWSVTAGDSVTAECGSVKAGKSVTAERGSVKAGKSVTAERGSVKAGGSVTAGLNIFARGNISATFRIFAGVASWLKSPSAEQKQIACGRLTLGEVCYGDLVETEKQEANRG
jgi:hypothetical protein